MLVFGVDVPLVEIVFVLSIIAGLLLLESIIVVMLLMKQMNKTKKVLELVENLSSTILSIKKAEIEELDHLRIGRPVRPSLSQQRVRTESTSERKTRAAPQRRSVRK